MTAAGLRFTPVRAADLAEVLAVERMSFPSPWSENLFLRELEIPFSRLLAARQNRDSGEILVGYVCRWLVDDEIHILNLAVHPDHRRRGVGRALVGLVLGEATARRISRVTLEVREENTAAAGLYAALGFVRGGLRKDYYGRGKHAVIMARRC